MDRVSVDLEYCYGIKKLHYRFDFSQRKAWAIYAPNGSMKTSFAQTFKDLANNESSEDRMFPFRTTVRTIVDENGAELPEDSVLVLPPYDEFFSHTEKTSTLLVNNTLRQEYEELHAEIAESKKKFLTAMKKQSGSKKRLDQEIALAFTRTDEDEAFYLALNRIKDELVEQPDAPFASIKYDSIFEDNVLNALGEEDFQTAIQDYITRYNQLLASSTYFKKGTFEYYNASQIAKTLAKNGFFDAKHTITLHAGEKLEIGTQEQLEKLIAAELNTITNDEDLKTKFDAIKGRLEKNATLRGFHQYLCDHVFLLPHLANIDLLKERIWKSYFKANESLYCDLLEKYERVKARRREIEEEARDERTLWEKAIELFNDRFFVPFKLEVKNKAAVALGSDAMLDLGYTFEDDGNSVQVERDRLMKSLSQGEKKALYILNIIFEIEVRRQSGQETLFIVDDIADSFDYKNKYAIIQYLQDISEEPAFKQIILTHNFDFFRTIKGRFIGYSGCLMATKSLTDVVLTQASGIDNPFVKDWKASFFRDRKKKIATIPFMRNLIEYIHGDKHSNYIKLTSLLHWKEGSATITQQELDDVYVQLFGVNGASSDGSMAVVDIIKQEANACLSAGSGANFENKIVLSIAIRLAAEQFMANKIADPKFLANIQVNQTQALLKEFKQKFSEEDEAVRILQNVVLMTPENIHLNAFMYEPILDMSDEHLKQLYSTVLNLDSEHPSVGVAT